MKNLTIKKISGFAPDPSPSDISRILSEQTASHAIDAVNWPLYPHGPEILFHAGHVQNEIWLSFNVSEKNPRARVTHTNGPVYQDSCVEFFISPRSDGHYYNIEMNSLGTVLAGYGSGRHDLELLDAAVVSKIRTYPSPDVNITPGGADGSAWHLVVAIPADFFIHDRVETFSGMRSRGNFHSCSDLAEKKRYLTWSPVATAKPDFHRYEFFGGLVFE